MVLKFKKGVDELSTLTCIRRDGSVTWTKLHLGNEMHEFAHFVVETQLGYNDAFYGTLLKGFDITDFELPRTSRPDELIPINLSVHALQTEHIVNLLQVGFNDSNANINIIKVLNNVLTENGITFPVNLDQNNLNSIISRLNELWSLWINLSRGETLELVFDPMFAESKQ